MNKTTTARIFVMGLILFAWLDVIYPASSYSLSSFYVDPNWAGSQSGSANSPWSKLGSSAWSAINAALASDDVTIYFSARNAGSAVDEIYGSGIEITNKAANPIGHLTFDGESKYNTNEASSSWIDYSGNLKCEVNYFNAQNSAHIKYNNVTIKGFRIVMPNSGKAVTIAGDNWTITDCDISHAPGVTDGPLVLIVPTSDSAHEGSSSWTPPCSNIVISNNTMHDSQGELIYLGGGGTNPGEAGSGYPSHTNITINNNTLYNGGVRGGQGDGIDIKGGITNLTIRKNEIYNITYSGTRAIVMQGQIVGGANQNFIIEQNYIHDSLGALQAIGLSNSWGLSKGVEIRNNIITTVGGEGITVYSGGATGISIYNNTIYNAASVGIRVDSGSAATIANNALLANNSGGSQTSLQGTIASYNNAYSGTWSGPATNCYSGLQVSSFVDVIHGNFNLSTGSLLLDKGVPIDDFSDDYYGTPRLQVPGWDIGAVQTTILQASQPPALQAPTGLRIK